METDILPTVEITVPADSWERSGDELNSHYQSQSGITPQDLARMQEDYLSSGGKIQCIATGVSANHYGAAGTNTAPSRFNSPYLPGDQAKHEIKRRAAIYSGDAAMVELIASLLPKLQLKKELAAACKCSDDRVQRILRAHFSDDPAAKKFMRVSL